MATHTLTIDDWWPCRLNLLMRQHWSERNRRLRQDAQIVGCEAYLQQVPKALGKRRVRVLVRHRAASTPPDPDALLKSLLDALVKAGQLTDDSPTGLVLAGVAVTAAQRKGVVVMLEDVD